MEKGWRNPFWGKKKNCTKLIKTIIFRLRNRPKADSKLKALTPGKLVDFS